MTGTSPKQHHFIPRFCLERFTNLDGHVWTFDKVTDKVFVTSPSKLARASGFYEAPALGTEIDQTAMEDMPHPIAPLWVDGHHTYSGLNDKILIELAGSVTASLLLLQVDRIRLVVCTPREHFGDNERRVKGQFQHAHQRYALWITDPGLERTYLAKPNGTYAIGECCLTISLGEPYKDACYKLIAAIILAT